MKKIYSMFLLTLCVLIVGCNNDDDENISDALKVVSAETTFTAAGGTGTIKVTGTADINASSNQDWCTVNVTGDIVSVTVGVYEELESRTALVTITAGENVQKVPVTQAGAILYYNETNYFNDEESTQVVFNTTLPYTLGELSDDVKSWLSLEQTDKGVVASVKENDTGAPRAANFTVTCRGKEMELMITQSEITDMVGEWVAQYIDYNGKAIQTKLTLKKTATNTLSGVGFLATYPIAFTYVKGNLEIGGGQWIGTYNGDDGIEYFSIDIRADDGYRTWSTSTSYESSIVMSQGVPVFVFGDNGSFSGRHIVGFFIYAYKAKVQSSANSLYYYLRADNLMMIKL